MPSFYDRLRSQKGVIKFIFFSNYFYGLCAVALSIEASLQQRFPLNAFPYYLFSFALTVLYYTRAYITGEKKETSNPRTRWYWENRRLVLASQLLFTVVFLLYVGNLALHHSRAILELPVASWIVLLVFPAVAALYYGINHRSFRIKLRNIGWLKPFIIGFVWAGLVNFYPVVFHNITEGTDFAPGPTGVFLFVKNFMFVTVLCVMFDIKDYATDKNQQLKTFVVKAGLRKTIFLILIPLSLAGLASFLAYGFAKGFSVGKLLLNTIPFLLLVAVAYSLHRRKSIFYYLIVIDGLMLIKAGLGITAMLLF